MDNMTFSTFIRTINVVSLILFTTLPINHTTNAFSPSPRSNILPLTSSFALTTTTTSIPTSNTNDKSSTQLYNHRRQVLSHILLGGGLILTKNPPLAVAAEPITKKESLKTPSEPSKKPNFTQNEIASFLHPIPTFAIVDSKGVPYMVVGEDAKLSAYFFTTYDEANRILSIASKSTDKALKELKEEMNEKRLSQGLKTMSSKEVEDEVGINPWKFGKARISALPLDFSITLANRGKVAGSYFRIAPDEDDIQDALKLEKLEKELPEGKVPLFYMDDFELDGKIPLYFQKSQLMKEYNKNGKKIDGKDNASSSPEIKVTELFSILGQMAGSGEVDDDLKKLFLVPPSNSVEKAKLCEKKGGKESPYKIGERIIVL